MERVVKFFIDRPLMVYLVSILIVAAGFITLTGLNRQIFPDVSLQRMQIETIYSAASARDVEVNVTTPIEEKVLEVDGIDKVRSVSMENFSMVIVTIDPDVADKDEVKADIRRAVDQVTDLPDEIQDRPNVYEIKTSWIPIVRLGLSSPELSEQELRAVALRMEKEIEAIPGVARVDKLGYNDREIRVLVSPEKLEQYYLSLQDIALAIKARNIRLTGGTLESFADETSVLTLAEFSQPEEIGEVILRSNFAGQRMVISDVADIVDGFEKRHFQHRVNGKAGITLRVHKKPSADSINTMKKVHQYLKTARETLPPSLNIEMVRNTAKKTLRTLNILRNNAFIGFVLVVGILVLFLNFRVAFWTALGIPIALAAGILGHAWTGGSLDSVAITAFILVLGMLVDDAIVVAENIHRHEEEGMPRVQAAIKGVSEVAAPIAATVSTTVVAFTPMLSLGGMLGPFVVMIPIIIGGALTGSLIESFFILPSHLAAGGHKVSTWAQRGAIIDPIFKPLRRQYRQLLEKVLERRYLVIVLALGLLGATAYLAGNHMKFVLFPQEGSEAVMIHLETDSGSSYAATLERVQAIEKIIQALPAEELDSFETWVGRYVGMGGEDFKGDNLASIYVTFTPGGERRRQAVEIVDELRRKAAEISGFRTINFEIDNGGPPVGRAVELNILSEDIEMQKRIVDELLSYLRKIPGVLDPDSNLKYTKDEEVIHIDYAELARVGLSAADVASTVRMAFEGEIVSSVRFQQEEVDIRVQLDEASRQRKETLLNLIVRNRMGKLIPLKKFIRLERKPALQGIRHYQGQRVVTLSADVDTNVITSNEVKEKIQAWFSKRTERFPGIRLVISGEAEESAKTIKNIQRAGVLAILAVYFILVLLLNSLTQPLIILFAIPFGVIGVIAAFWLHGMTLGFLALIGMLGMSGVVVNDSLIILSFINHLARERREAHRCSYATILDAAQTRLRPVLLTTITTAVALFPTAYGLGGSDHFVIPMVMAMLWGIVFATALTLIWVPTLYAIGQDIKKILHMRSRWAEERCECSEAIVPYRTTQPQKHVTVKAQLKRTKKGKKTNLHQD